MFGAEEPGCTERRPLELTNALVTEWEKIPAPSFQHLLGGLSLRLWAVTAAD